MHHVEAALGMPLDADPDAVIDALEAIRWTTGETTLLVLRGELLVHVLETDAAGAERLAGWLAERGPCRLAELLREHEALAFEPDPRFRAL